MPFSGGTFTRLYDFTDVAASATPTIQSSQMDAELDGIATALSKCILKDGTQSVTANIPFGGYDLTNVGTVEATTLESTTADVNTADIDLVRVGTTDLNPPSNQEEGVRIVQGTVFAYRTSEISGRWGRSDDGSVHQFFRNGSITGSISFSGSSTAYNTSSDRRLKTNIADLPLAEAEAVFEAMRPRKYDLVEGDTGLFGFIADEWSEACPRLVLGEPDGPDMQQITTSDPSVIAVLVTIIDDLRARVAELEAE